MQILMGVFVSNPQCLTRQDGERLIRVLSILEKPVASTNLSDPYKAREHARAQAGAKVRAMPTVPASAAIDLPAGVSSTDVVWDETLAGGDYCSRVLTRGARVRVTNVAGDGCVSLLAFNADQPIERLNVADTVKVQWNAYLGPGKLLLSDMGRVLLTIVADTCGQHDAFCGASNARSNLMKYGAGENYSLVPNARDRFLIALLKHGLGKKDIPSNINLFKGVKVEADGALTFNPSSSKPGDYVELRAEMNVLLVLVNSPHVLDPRSTYTCSDVRVTAWRGPTTPESDPFRNASPENVRAFQNVEDFFL